MRQRDIKTPAHKESPHFQNQQFTSKPTIPASAGEQLFITARAVSSISFRSIPRGWK